MPLEEGDATAKSTWWDRLRALRQIGEKPELDQPVSNTYFEITKNKKNDKKREHNERKHPTSCGSEQRAFAHKRCFFVHGLSCIPLLCVCCTVNGRGRPGPCAVLCGV